MAKKQESQDTGPLLRALQQVGWFRKLNDTVQEGLPDIIGVCERGYGLEIKSINEVPRDGMVPPKGAHPFSKIQVRELMNIHKNGGVGVGIIICGKVLVYCYPWEIDENGRTKWNPDRVICKKDSVWDGKVIIKSITQDPTRMSGFAKE